MWRFSPSVLAGVLAFTGVALFAPSAQAQYGQHNYQQHKYMDYATYQRYLFYGFLPQAPTHEHWCPPHHNYPGAFHGNLDQGAFYPQQFYNAPGQSYYQQPPSFYFGYQNRNSSIQFRR